MDLLRMTMSDALALSKSRNRTMNLSAQPETDEDNMQPQAPATTSGHRMVRRRASRACHYCRAKKIKCSVVKSGSPCNTCRLDEVECLVSMVRRKRRPRVAGVLVDRPSAESQDGQRHWDILKQLPASEVMLEPSDSLRPNEDSRILHSIGL
jgi:hypothetical protein